MMDEKTIEKLVWLEAQVNYLLTLEQAGALKPYGAYDGTGNVAIIGAAATLNLDTENMAHSNYTLAADTITVTATGRYAIWAKVVYDVIDLLGSSFGSVDIWLEEDSAGWAEIAGSRARTYHREVVGAGSGAAAFAPIVLSAGDAVRVRVQRINGTTSIDTTPNYSSIMILKVG